MTAPRRFVLRPAAGRTSTLLSAGPAGGTSGRSDRATGLQTRNAPQCATMHTAGLAGAAVAEVLPAARHRAGENSHDAI